MALTPVEIRHLSPSSVFRGYKKEQVDLLFAEIAASFEDVWRERADLADKVEQLEHDIVRYKELEALLRTTLVSAERAASELKEQARREADIILAEAHSEARAVQRRALDLPLQTQLRRDALLGATTVPPTQGGGEVPPGRPPELSPPVFAPSPPASPAPPPGG